MAKVETKKQALTALRKAGWEKTQMQMTRGAMTYGVKGAGWSAGTITMSDFGFIVTTGGNPKWSLISAALTIENLKVKANEKVLVQIAELRERGLLGEEVGLFELVVAIGKAIVQDRAKESQDITPAP